MKAVLLKQMVLVALMALGGVAEARLYRCTFDKPRSEILISTKLRSVSFVNDGGIGRVAIKRVKKATLVGETRHIFILENGDDVQVALTTPYKEISTGYYYPFMASHRGQHGGCESEDRELESMVVRNKSFVNALGDSVATGWSGELAAFNGFKVTNTVTLPPGSTWKDLVTNGRESLSCTLTKGLYFVPAVQMKGQKYVHLDRPVLSIALKSSGLREDDFNFKKGDELVNLSRASDGQCLVEKNGILFDVTCAEMKSKYFQNVLGTVALSRTLQEMRAVPESGDYVYTQCGEGHYTWISAQTMKEDIQHFEDAAVKPF